MKKLAVTSVLLAFAGVAFAQDITTTTTPADKLKKPILQAMDGNQTEQMPEIVVTPTRNPEPETKVGSAVSVVSGEEIARTQSVTLQQAVNLTPGIFAEDAGAPGGYPTFSIRGNRPSDSLILLDGVPLNTEMFQDAAPFLANAGTNNLESIEIVRGPQSTLYGSAGIGGVISLQTLMGQGTPWTDVYGEAGSFGTTREGIESQGALGKAAYSVSYERDNTENDRWNNDLALNRYSVRLDYQIVDNLSLTLNFDGVDGHYQEPGSVRPQDYASNDPTSHTEEQGNLVSATVNWKVTDFWTQKLILGTYFERYVLIDLPYEGNFFTPTHYVSNAINYSADWQNTLQLAHNDRLTAGLDFNEFTGHDNTFNEQYLSDWAGYAQDEWEPVTNLNLTGGVRYDGYQLAGDALTYRFTGAYLFPKTDTKIRASYGTAFKAPSFLELFSSSAFQMGNPGLKPERSRGWDMGVDQYLLDRRVTLSATYFQNRIHDLIDFVQTSLVTGYYENEDSARNQGVELGADLDLYRNWKSRISYTWMDPTATVQGVTQTRDELPRNDLSLDTSYLFFDKLTVGCGVSFVGGRVDTDYSLFPASQVKLNDYWTARIYSRYAFNDHFSIFARIENVTNSHYEEALGFPELPLGVYAGAEIKF